MIISLCKPLLNSSLYTSNFYLFSQNTTCYIRAIKLEVAALYGVHRTWPRRVAALGYGAGSCRSVTVSMYAVMVVVEKVAEAT